MSWDETATSALLTAPGGKLVPEQVTGDESQQSMVVRYECRGAQVVEASGDYDMHSVGPLADALKTATETHPKVVLDASGVTFADSTFLNLVILTHQTGKLRVAAPSERVRRLCAITGVDDVLQIWETVDDAIAS
ncbi:anti-sigma factor antagonist [Streptomyces litmocidini]|uniref:STAS domain-containing protein n=1 Tax=Streptomyces litmocidini TaxID=67318 RepID=UPI00167D449A|nr:STAS domain-containing protein [Streptomyces litmocidini]GGU83236.1 anti-sigma factor antagonist [Streptomyces litmocidini]